MRVPYGVDQELDGRIDSAALKLDASQPARPPLVDVAAAVREAIQSPLDFPPLAAAVVPGDRVVIALDEGLPALAELVAPVVQMLLAAGVEASDITLLQTAFDFERNRNDPTRLVPAEVRADLERAKHLASDRESIGYLAATASGHRVYLNRVLLDADLVIPIATARPDILLDEHSGACALWPLYSDEATQLRYRQAAAQRFDPARAIVSNADLQSDINEVMWLLGPQCLLQVIPAGGHGVTAVMAGQLDPIRRLAPKILHETWPPLERQTAELVIAALHGDATQQSWDTFARALMTALAHVEPHRSIAIISDLGIAPSDHTAGPALKLLERAKEPQKLIPKLERESAIDVAAALALIAATQQAQVFLLSRLEPAFVESLGMAPLDGASALERLIERHGACIVIGDAQYRGPGR